MKTYTLDDVKSERKKIKTYICRLVTQTKLLERTKGSQGIYRCVALFTLEENKKFFFCTFFFFFFYLPIYLKNQKTEKYFNAFIFVREKQKLFT